MAGGRSRTVKWCFSKGVVTLSFVQAALLMCTVGGQNTANVASCLPTGATSASNEPSKPNLPDSYRVKLEVTVEGRNVTQEAEEIVDNAGNRAVLTVMNQGQQLTLLYNYDTQQVLYVSGDGNCTVHNLTSDVARFAFYGESIIDNRAHLLDGASSLFFGSSIPKVYVGTSVIRGMQCNCWQACLVWPGSNKNFTINYYFTVAEWGTASMFSQVPVRYDVNGTEMSPNGTSRAFHRVYDFFDFIPDSDGDPTVFQTDEGVVCPGRTAARDMPTMTSHFYHFREEIIDIYQGLVTMADVWYDMDHKLVRLDYRSPDKTPPLDTTNPISEIHDFNYGARYVKDLASGQCVPMPLLQQSFDSKVNVPALLNNGTLVMSMKNPLSFFFLDSNFSYVGQRTARDVLCDVFISIREDYDLFNNGSAFQANVETYFLADGWAEVANSAMADYSQNFPFRIHLLVPKMNFNLVYNIYDFDTEEPEIDVFDVTECYNDSASVHFRVRFPGPYTRDTEHMVRLKGQNALAMSMQVSPLRVNRVHVDNDANYLYLSAYLLDRTPALVQFTHLPNMVVETAGDASWGGVASAAACANLCVFSPDMTCLSFLYCAGDRQACHISRQHVSDGQPTVVSGTCDLYSRSVDIHLQPETTIQDAFTNLQGAIAMDMLSFDIIIQDQNQDIPYVGVNAEILFGEIKSPVPSPALTGQYSYRVEIVYTRHNLVNTYDVWYDSQSLLVREDRRDVSAGPPYYSPFTITTIQDFNKGVAYNIDQHRGNCTVTPIPTDNLNGFHQPVNLTLVNQTGVEVLVLKTASQMFYLDQSYVYTGQRTVRGILCNVFESKRSDFSIGPGTEHSIFQYFFQDSSWQYDADNHEDITMQQPVQLTILDMEANEFMVLNFYDFNDERTAVDHFNIAPCFDDDHKIDFVLQFNQTYHPYLDTQEWEFRQQVQLALAKCSRVSEMRVQIVKVMYNLDSTYVMVTLLGETDPINHFVEAGVSSPYAAAVSAPQQDVPGCASVCYYSNQMVCNSFDLCSDQTCYLSTQHRPDANVTDTNTTCRHFSRLVNGTVPEAILEDAFTSIKDYVYKGLLYVTVSGPNSTQVNFVATDIRDDILQQTPLQGEGGWDLDHKFQLFRTGAQMSGYVWQEVDLAVDECATACLSQMDYICNSFTYCYTTATCFLNVNNPALNTSLVTSNDYCDVFARLYLNSYTAYLGQVMQMTADSKVTARNAEVCARDCSTYVGTFACRSFDMCTDGSCLLHHQHVLDPNTPVSNSTTCTHYSRSYLPDYAVQRGKAVPGPYATVIDGVTPTTCAFQCSQQGTCHSFLFCQGQCRLLSAQPTASSIAGSTQCDLYMNNGTTTSSPGNTAKTTSAARTTSAAKTTSAARTTSAPTTTTTKPTTTKTPAPNTRSPGVTNTPIHTPPSSTAQNAGCANGQKQSSDSSSSIGAQAGIGVGCAAGGVLLGVGLVLLVQRIIAKRQEGGDMELILNLAEL